MRAQGELPEGQEGGLGHRALCMEKAESATRGPHPSASQTPVRLAVPENCCGLTLFLAVFERCGNSGFTSSATGSAKPEFPERGEGLGEREKSTSNRISDRRRYDDQ